MKTQALMPRLDRNFFTQILRLIVEHTHCGTGQNVLIQKAGNKKTPIPKRLLVRFDDSISS